MDAFDPKQLKTIVEKLLEISKCPVCLEKVSTDSIHCVRGHFLCSGCKGAMEKCPLCEGTFSEEKTSTVTQQLVEALPSACRHRGCQLYLAEDDEHEKYCGFRPTTCELEECEWEGPGKDINKHVKEMHKNSFILKEGKHALVWRNYTHNSVRHCTNFVRSHGQFLWLIISKDPFTDSFTFVLKLIPNGNCIDDLYFKVVFISTGSNISCKIKLNLDPDTCEGHIIVVSWQSLLSYVNNEGELAFKCYFKTS